MHSLKITHSLDKQNRTVCIVIDFLFYIGLRSFETNFGSGECVLYYFWVDDQVMDEQKPIYKQCHRAFKEETSQIYLRQPNQGESVSVVSLP